MDAYDISEKLRKYCLAIFSNESEDCNKKYKKIKVYVSTEYGLREIVGVQIVEDKIVLIRDED